MSRLSASISFAIVLMIALMIALMIEVNAGAPSAPRRLSEPAYSTNAPAAVAASPGQRRPVTPAAINSQDRVSREHDRREARAFDARPLLAKLPLTADGVRIDIAGLDADGVTTLIEVNVGRRGVDHARAVYRNALDTADDTGHAYRAIFRR